MDLVRIEDTPLFMGWASGFGPGLYVKINPSMVALMDFGHIMIRNHPMVIYRKGGGEEQIPVGDTVRLWP
jgi:hypothetical protein